MARHCEQCGHDYSDMEQCPYCASHGQRNGKHSGKQAGPDVAGVSLPTGLDAHIDLGSPVTGNTGSEGPPSGASFISWTALLRRKKRAANATPPPGCIPVLAVQGTGKTSEAA